MTPSGRGHERLAVAKEAGFSRYSFVSVLAGTVTAFGTFAAVAALVGAILAATDVHTEFRTDDWTGSGAAGGLLTAVVLLISYVFGGYVAGRMARRSALLHGVAVFVLSLVVGAVIGAIAAVAADPNQVGNNLRSAGIPTSTDQVTGVALAAVIASAAAMLIGAVLGSLLGGRWHTKLARRAFDPSYGPAAASRRRAAVEEVEGRRHVEQDEVIFLDESDPDRPSDHKDDERVEPVRRSVTQPVVDEHRR